MKEARDPNRMDATIIMRNEHEKGKPGYRERFHKVIHPEEEHKWEDFGKHVHKGETSNLKICLSCGLVLYLIGDHDLRVRESMRFC